MKVQRYSPEHKAEWDAFVAKSKNGTFLFYRDYMSYHQDRFRDHSLLFYDHKESLIAIFPANEREQLINSHGGLSYGGFVSDERMKVPKLLACFQALLSYAQDLGFKEIIYKCIPHIYHRNAAQEDMYILNLIKATCISRTVITSIDTAQPLDFQSRRLQRIKIARKNSIIVQETQDLSAYWELLSTLLQTNHGAKPVHSLAEIEHLHGLFPKNIRLFASYLDGEMLAGILVYESTQVARTQYIASSPKGRDLGALDLIFDHLIRDVYSQKPYIEFGTSERVNTPNYLNPGLIDQKEGFGARAIIQDIYLVDINNPCNKAIAEAYN